MADMRKKKERRTVLFHLKLHQREADSLRAAADANCRTPGEQIRYMVGKELDWFKPAEGEGKP